MSLRFFTILLTFLNCLGLKGQTSNGTLQNFANPALFNLSDSTCLNMSGEWLGEEIEYTDQNKTIKGKYSVKFILQQQGNRVSGNSFISFDNGQSFGNMKIRGMVSGNKLYFEEYEIVDQNFITPNVLWCLRTGELDFKVSGNTAMLQGSNYKGYAAVYYFECAGWCQMNLGKTLNARELEYAGKNVTPEKDFEMLLHPNPAMHEVTVSFKIAKDQQVRIDLFDLTGRLRGNMVDGYFAEGTHSKLFNLSNFEAGVYLIRMQAGKELATGHLVIAR